MRIEGQEESENVEDRRSVSPRGMVLGGGAGTLILIVVVMLLGGDPMQLLQQQPGPPGQNGPALQPGPGNGAGGAQQDPELTHFVSVVLRSTEVVWDDVFRQRGQTYRKPTLTLFNNFVDSACGTTSSAVGPFYCPEDEHVYLDLSFYRDLKSRFGAPGDFAQAYVIAHEVGHHVQKLLGIADKVAAARRRASRQDANRLSVRLELQADFFAGVWAKRTEQRLFVDEHDINEALNCAQAIGDDRLQQETRGRVVPDSFTHGTSEQRARWFKLGWTTGDISKGDTFNAEEL
jgi:predicted metalloprotease